MHDVIVCTSTGEDLVKAPDEIKLLPLGMVHSQKGDFTVDEESFNLIRQQYKGRALDLVIDYEHQTLKDIQAPAAAWIKDLRMGEDSIVAKVEWTKRAKEYLANKEYRYLSPVVMVRKSDKKAVAIHSAALTNTPAIDGMFAIVNSLGPGEAQHGGRKMELSEIAKLLGLDETATEEEIKTALAAAGKKSEELKDGTTGEKTGDNGQEKEESLKKSCLKLDPTILTLLGLKEDARTEDVAASIVSLKNGGTGIAAEMLALKEKLEKKEAEESVLLALKEGKISAAQKEWATSYALKDPEGFKNFVEKAPRTVPVGKLELKDDEKKPAQGEYSMEVLKAMGFTQADVEKYLKEE